MTGPADKKNDASDWDSLFAELGIDSVEPAKPAPAVPPATKPVPPPPPTPEVKKIEVAVVKPTVIAPPPVAEEMPFGVDLDDEKSGDDTVMEEGPESPEDDLATGEAAAEGGKEGDVRRRRRRRRRKKGPGEAVPVAAEGIEVAESEPTEPIVEDAPAEIVGEAAPELEDDSDDDDSAPAPATLDAELEDDSTEPLPEWKVMAWTDLLATLYRPER